MKMRKVTHSVTSLPVNPVDERRQRVIKYSITMSIRVVCLFAMLFVQGWWLLFFALGAVLLPWFAVLIANQQMRPAQNQAEAISPLSISASDSDN